MAFMASIHVNFDHKQPIASTQLGRATLLCETCNDQCNPCGDGLCTIPIASPRFAYY